jgi:surface protein
MALFTAILFSGAFTPSGEEIAKLDDTLTQLKSKDDSTLKTNATMIDKILSSHNVTGGYENDNYRYIYYMNLNATDKLAIFVITEIKNSEYGFIKTLGMQKDFIMLIDANAPNKLVWKGYSLGMTEADKISRIKKLLEWENIVSNKDDTPENLTQDFDTYFLQNLEDGITVKIISENSRITTDTWDEQDENGTIIKTISSFIRQNGTEEATGVLKFEIYYNDILKDTISYNITVPLSEYDKADLASDEIITRFYNNIVEYENDIPLFPKDMTHIDTTNSYNLEVECYSSDLYKDKNGNIMGGSYKTYNIITKDCQIFEQLEDTNINLNIQFKGVNKGYGLGNSLIIKKTDNTLDYAKHQPANPIEYEDKTAFITKWDTTKEGNTSSNQIKITTNQSYDYNYNINWGDGKSDSGVIGDIIHTYDAEGIYTIQITGEFPAIYFYNLNVNYSEQKYEVGNSDNYKLISIEQWGTQEWKSMSSAFVGCENMVGNFLDTPNLSSVNDMSYMFQGARIFNQDISDWDVSNVIIMAVMFNGANSFNQDISSWDVSNVNVMFGMFTDASSFNQDITNWDVSSVTSMSSMFFATKAFNQDLSGWDVSSVTEHEEFMKGAGANAIEPIWKD